MAVGGNKRRLRMYMSGTASRAPLRGWLRGGLPVWLRGRLRGSVAAGTAAGRAVSGLQEELGQQLAGAALVVADREGQQVARFL